MDQPKRKGRQVRRKGTRFREKGVGSSPFIQS
jgi:hypothetical protein